jgi:hypothetical protein
VELAVDERDGVDGSVFSECIDELELLRLRGVSSVSTVGRGIGLAGMVDEGGERM